MDVWQTFLAASMNTSVFQSPADWLWMLSPLVISGQLEKSRTTSLQPCLWLNGLIVMNFIHINRGMMAGRFVMKRKLVTAFPA